MTTEIEKLYENAGIKTTYTDECQMADSYYCMEKDLNERGILFDDYMKQQCPNKNEMCYETCPYAYNKEFYPPFTAEKQLELIKWLAKKNYGDYTSSLLINITNDRIYFSAGAKPKYYVIEVLYDSNRCTDFENALANLINNLWQDLTEEEKEQIRGILE